MEEASSFMFVLRSCTVNFFTRCVHNPELRTAQFFVHRISVGGATELRRRRRSATRIDVNALSASKTLWQMPFHVPTPHRQILLLLQNNLRYRLHGCCRRSCRGGFIERFVSIQTPTAHFAVSDENRRLEKPHDRRTVVTICNFNF